MNSAKNVKAVFEKKPASGGLLHTIPNFQPGMYVLDTNAGFYTMLVFDGDIIRSMSAAATAVRSMRGDSYGRPYPTGTGLILPCPTEWWYTTRPPGVVRPYVPITPGSFGNHGYGWSGSTYYYYTTFQQGGKLGSNMDFLKLQQYDVDVVRWNPVATVDNKPDDVDVGTRYSSYFVVIEHASSLYGPNRYDTQPSLNIATCLQAWSLADGVRIPLNSNVGGLDYEDRLYTDGRGTWYAHITPPPNTDSWMLQVDPIVDPYLANQECANFFFEATTSYPQILGGYGQIQVRVDFPDFGNYPKPPPLIWAQLVTPLNSVDSFGVPASSYARGIQCRRLPATGCKFTIQYTPGRSSIALIENASNNPADHAKLLRGDYEVMNELSAVPNWFALRVKP